MHQKAGGEGAVKRMNLRESSARRQHASDACPFMRQGADSIIVYADAGMASAFLFIARRVRILVNMIFLLRGILGFGIRPMAPLGGVRP